MEKTPFSFRTILFISFCFFCAGDALGISAGQPARWWPVAAALLAAGGLARYQREPLLAVFFLCAGAGGFLLGTSDGPVRQAWHQRYGTEVALTGEWEPASLASREQGMAGTFVVHHPLPGKIRVFLRGSPPDLPPPDTWSTRQMQLRGVVRSQIFRANPGCYNSALAARVKRVYGRMSVSAGDWKVLPARASLLHRWEGAVQQEKTQLLRRLRRSEGALLLGMVLGGYEGVREEDAEVLRQNGLAHLMAVSGTHVALLLAFAWLFLKRWESPWKTAFLLGLLAAYAVACSLRPAVLRAVLMASALLWGRLRGRRTDPLRLLLLVAWVLLLWQPLWLVDVGFQLSFVTVAGLLLCCPRVQEWIPDRCPGELRAMLAVTVTAQLVTVPFLVWYFHQFVPLSLVSNLLLVPAMEAAVLLFLPVLAFSLLAPAICAAAALPAEFLLSGVLQAGRWLAALPGSVITVADWGWLRSLAYYGCLALILDAGPCVFVPARPRRLLLALLAAILFLPSVTARLGPHPLDVHFLDVGQGDAALLRTPGGRAVLLDTGGLRGYDTGRQIVLPYLRFYGLTGLDVLVLSHGDEDHVGGARTVVTSLPVRELWLGQGADTPAVASLLRHLPQETKVVRLRRGEVRHIGDAVFLVAGDGSGQDVQHTMPETETNAASLILAVRVGTRTLLFPGDAGQDTEEAALPWLGPCDVLKVSHHGARTSSSPQFLERLRPRWAVVSVGQGNRYGHPSPDTLSRLDAVGAEILRTDRLGAIRLVFDDSGGRWYSYKRQKEGFAT
ncbi:MAG: hypothetical protein ACFWT7_08130 [Succiniclasticum sp.]